MAVVGLRSRCIDIVALDDGQTPLLIVHCKTLTPPEIPVTLLASNVGVVMVSPPDIKLQFPVPIAGVFPANTVAVAQIV